MKGEGQDEISSQNLHLFCGARICLRDNAALKRPGIERRGRAAFGGRFLWRRAGEKDDCRLPVCHLLRDVRRASDRCDWRPLKAGVSQGAAVFLSPRLRRGHRGVGCHEGCGACLRHRYLGRLCARCAGRAAGIPPLLGEAPSPSYPHPPHPPTPQPASTSRRTRTSAMARATATSTSPETSTSRPLPGW